MEFFEKLKPLALLLLRLALGLIYMYHGFPKLFGQTAKFQQLFASVGLPASWVYVSGVLEVFGGALLIVGLFTRVVALLLTIEMGVALWKVHLVHGIYSLKDYEFPLTLAVAAFTLATLGAGVASIDYPIFHGRGGGAKAKSKS